jgi:hypothetical protein
MLVWYLKGKNVLKLAGIVSGKIWKMLRNVISGRFLTKLWWEQRLEFFKEMDEINFCSALTYFTFCSTVDRNMSQTPFQMECLKIAKLDAWINWSKSCNYSSGYARRKESQDTVFLQAKTFLSCLWQFSSLRGSINFARGGGSGGM